MRKFNMASLLVVATYYLFSDMRDVYAILGYMTGESLCTHQIPRFLEECRPYIVEQHPFLKKCITAWDNVDKNHPEYRTLVFKFLDDLISIYGNEFEVYPIHQEDHEHIDPIEEYKQMRPDSNPIVIDLNEDDIDPVGNIGWKAD